LVAIRSSHAFENQATMTDLLDQAKNEALLTRFARHPN